MKYDSHYSLSIAFRCPDMPLHQIKPSNPCPSKLLMIDKLFGVVYGSICILTWPVSFLYKVDKQVHGSQLCPL